MDVSTLWNSAPARPVIRGARRLPRTPKKSERGFTLVELIAVTAIIVLVTSVVLAGNSRFGGVVQLQTLAYDIALSIRQAQVYGIAVSNVSQSNFAAPYGINFDLSSPTTYVIFADAYPSVSDGLYDPAHDALVSAPAIAQAYAIFGLCKTKGAAETCSYSTDGSPRVSRVDVVFRRPEPDAWISAKIDGVETSCILDNSSCQESARVILRSPRGETMSVIVEANGQISVRNGS